MKLVCQRPLLANAFQIVSAVVPARTPKDVLKDIKLEITDGKAVLIGTDQEIGVRCELQEVETDSNGAVLLPKDEMSSILREVQDEQISLELTEQALWVRAGHSEFKLAAKDPTEFPPVAGFEEEQCFTVTSGALKQVIRRTIYAADVESTRYALGGVLAEFADGQLTLVATDTRRMALATVPAQGDGVELPGNEPPIIPVKAMSLLERSIEDEDTEVRIAFRVNDMVARCGPTTIYSRLVEGKFPNYRAVIPSDSKYTIELSVSPFYGAVRQSQIVVSTETRGVDFIFTSGLLTLKSMAADVGESTIELPIAYDGEDMSIGFDPQYVAEYLRVLDAGTNVQLHLIDHEHAAVFRTDDGYVYLVMPLTREE